MVQDDLELYFYWKSSKEYNALPEVETVQKDLKNKLKIANKLLENAKIPVKATKKFQVPTNSQIEIINKWKRLEQADKELSNTRAAYQDTIQEYSRRWRDIESRQTLLKSNLVRYNNFVREKQGKVADGVSRTILEKKKQVRKTEECLTAEKDWEVLVEAKAVLNVVVDNKKLFNNYLDSVVKVSEEEYPDMRHLMDRCQALVATR